MTSPTPWQGDALDLDAYLARIGYDGAREPTETALHALIRAHTTAIPFENLETLLGRPVPLDPESLQRKLVRSPRGGWCYENAVLFAAALERFGFDFTALAGRVTMGAAGPVEVPTRPATHALLAVRVPESEHPLIADVGFGAGPLAAYPLTERGELALGDWRFRLERLPELWVLHQFAKDGWVDRYTFTEAAQYPIDYEVANHFVATSPRSPFTRRVFAQRFHPEVHHILDSKTWTAEYPDGRAESRELEPDELPKVLAEVFEIELNAADSARLVATVRD
ncbi:arylamine N-acetyltransferase family protein [Nocardia asteroides]|uniref:arylamine N-acetyltransferase family protein n=1 Tax=Nocardia asteroides TaxID=1824 RepID=UPI001E51CAD4|nr:arylamine N-acetyltransferase [Nocardia asteroides]UGT60779.1 arylamine N-acetyltransferase [Nocardia asteroides]